MQVLSNSQIEAVSGAYAVNRDEELPPGVTVDENGNAWWHGTPLF